MSKGFLFIMNKASQPKVENLVSDTTSSKTNKDQTKTQVISSQNMRNSLDPTSVFQNQNPRNINATYLDGSSTDSLKIQKLNQERGFYSKDSAKISFTNKIFETE
jgi:hypothetical protein